MKRILALLLALSLVLCFAGCEKKTSGDEEIPTLKWYCPGDKFPGTAEVLEAANKISVEKIGAKLDIMFLDNAAYNERIRMIMASGEPYDLCFAGYVNNYATAASMGGLEPLDELLKTTPALVESIEDFFWEAALVDGVTYGVPNMQIVAQTNGIFVRNDLMEKYDLDLSSIQSRVDFEPWFEKVKNGEKGVYPWRHINANFAEGTGLQELTIGISYPTKTKDIKIQFKDEHPAFIEGMNIRNRWFKKGYIRPDVVSVSDESSDFYAGKYATTVTSHKPGVEVNLKNQTGYDWTLVENLHEPFVKPSAPTATMICINPNSEYKEKAIKLIELLNTDKEYYNLICYGIEGKHYTKNENGTIKFVEGSNYKPDSAWKFGNQFNAYVVEGMDPDVWEQTKKLNAEAEKSELLGFVLNKDNIQTELAQLESVRKQYAQAYFLGAVKVDKGYDDYIKRMYQAGLETAMADIQKQVDDFMASKNK